MIILDWNRQKEIFKKKTEEEDFTPEMYCEQYINAEFPAEPHPADTSEEANTVREHRRFIANTMYHSCAVGRCKDKSTDACDKNFPVLFYLLIFLLFV